MSDTRIEHYIRVERIEGKLNKALSPMKEYDFNRVLQIDNARQLAAAEKLAEAIKGIGQKMAWETDAWNKKYWRLYDEDFTELMAALSEYQKATKGE